jgi:DNA-directed RNA polymerase subunit RPC12/RpoP
MYYPYYAQPEDYEEDAEASAKKCPYCRAKMACEDWCSICDMMTFVKDRDVEYQCVDCGAAIWKRSVGEDGYVFETEEGDVMCSQATIWLQGRGSGGHSPE